MDSKPKFEPIERRWPDDDPDDPVVGWMRCPKCSWYCPIHADHLEYWKVNYTPDCPECKGRQKVPVYITALDGVEILIEPTKPAGTGGGGEGILGTGRQGQLRFDHLSFASFFGERVTRRRAR